LLEIYANRKSVKQFDTLASELYTQTGGIGPEWENVAALGAALDPENPLYAAGRRVAPAEGGAAPVMPASVSETQSTVLLPGTLGVMAAGMGALAAAAPEVFAREDADAPGVVAEDAAGEDVHVSTNVTGDFGALDFELGETEQIAAFAAPAAEPVADIPLPQLESLDFDLESLPQESFSETEVNPNFSPTETLIMGAGAAADDLSETITGLEMPAEFSGSNSEAGTGLLDFDLGDTTAETQTMVNPSALHEGSSGDFGSDTIINPMDMQESDKGALSVTDGMAGMSVDYASEDAEFDINLNESVFLGQPMPVPEFDLTSINLDLTANPAEETEVFGLTEVLDSGAAVGDQGGEDVATKLALAKAYEEMGDHDQARELLEEVIAEGEGDLAEQARQILGGLNA
jgi:pilus assembly protein FimV